MDTRIVLDLDKMKRSRAISLVSAIGNEAAAYKVHSLADEHMAYTVEILKEAGAQTIMLDWKEYDMIDTIAQRAAKAKKAGVDWFTVHASGGPDMVRAAVENGPGRIIGITLLTSLTDAMIEYLYTQDPWTVVRKLALWAKEGGAKTLVCSPKQVANLADDPDLKDMDLIVPGTRSVGIVHHDQQQVDTPYNAMFNGATYLVGGRQITQADNPRGALLAMANEMRMGLEARAKLQDDIITETM